MMQRTPRQRTDLRQTGRREFLGGAALAAFATPLDAQPSAQRPEWVYLGTYTRGRSEGIYRVAFDAASGKMDQPILSAKTPSPSFLEWHPSRRFLYAVNEVGEFRGERGGSVTAFAVDAASGALTEIGAVSSKGPGPCHLMCSPDGKALVVANYSGGSTVSFRVGPDGKLSEAVSVVQHEGSSANQQRQRGPHAHGVAMRKHRNTLVAYVADLGIDKVLAYTLDTASAKLTPFAVQPSVAIAPGSGPRHVVTHPKTPLSFAIHELSNTLTAFRIDVKTGVWTHAETLGTLPADFSGTSYTAEIAVHPNGNFVYGSNRGHDSLAIFAVNRATGKLTPKGHVPVQGKTPRSFAIHPSGRALIVANQDTGNLASFRVDVASGALTYTGNQVNLDTPVCVLFP